jgi:hypothetical protein
MGLIVGGGIGDISGGRGGTISNVLSQMGICLHGYFEQSHCHLQPAHVGADKKVRARKVVPIKSRILE